MKATISKGKLIGDLTKTTQIKAANKTLNFGELKEGELLTVKNNEIISQKMITGEVRLATDVVEHTDYGLPFYPGDSEEVAHADHCHGTPENPMPGHLETFNHLCIPSEPIIEALLVAENPSAENHFITIQAPELTNAREALPHNHDKAEILNFEHTHSLQDVPHKHGVEDIESLSAHGHVFEQIEGVPDFEVKGHEHNYVKPEVLQTLAKNGHKHSYSELDNIPKEFKAEKHGHSFNELSDIPEEFPAKPHTHDIGPHKHDYTDLNNVPVIDISHSHGIEELPEHFHPHGHNIDEIRGYEHTHDFVPHTHYIEEIVNYTPQQVATVAKLESHSHTKQEIVDFPKTMPATAHTHRREQIEGFDHTHAIQDFDVSASEGQFLKIVNGKVAGALIEQPKKAPIIKVVHFNPDDTENLYIATDDYAFTSWVILTDNTGVLQLDITRSCMNTFPEFANVCKVKPTLKKLPKDQGVFTLPMQSGDIVKISVTKKTDINKFWFVLCE